MMGFPNSPSFRPLFASTTLKMVQKHWTDPVSERGLLNEIPCGDDDPILILDLF